MSESVHANTNRLINEKSPYLLQHAHNPVDWYPWGEEAFSKAKKEDKPIFLSIGYSTCHWCHVMEDESFSNPEIANIMNKYFVSIKVDREERPDIDNIYMTTVMAMTGSGGWPLTVFLTPNKKPFYGGTYFPPEDRWGMPGLKTLLLSIADSWAKRRDEALRSGESITQMPNAYPQMLIALDFALGPSKEIVVAGDIDAKETKEMIQVVYKRFIPNKVMAHRPAGDTEPIIALIPFIKEQIPLGGKTTAYVCKNYVCQLPTISIQKLSELFEE